MAGKTKQANPRRMGRFQSQPARTEANKERRWKKQFNKWKRKCEKAGKEFNPKFTSYDEEKKSH